VLLRGIIVLWQLRPVVNDDPGLKLTDHGVELLGTPVFRRVGPAAVVPQNVEFAIVGAQLTYLGVDIVHEF